MREFDAAKLGQQLDRILHTFRFVGPVVDGPGWRVHAGDGCDGTFEYPETDVVVTAIESTNERLNSNDITCEEYFSDRGLNYTVAEKVNLKDRNEFERWLKSFGYPDLSGARVEATSEYLTKYKAGSYYYIYGEGTAFILSVFDANIG